jgi:hypothetical protein
MQLCSSFSVASWAPWALTGRVCCVGNRHFTLGRRETRPVPFERLFAPCLPAVHQRMPWGTPPVDEKISAPAWAHDRVTRIVATPSSSPVTLIRYERLCPFLSPQNECPALTLWAGSASVCPPKGGHDPLRRRVPHSASCRGCPLRRTGRGPVPHVTEQPSHDLPHSAPSDRGKGCFAATRRCAATGRASERPRDRATNRPLIGFGHDGGRRTGTGTGTGTSTGRHGGGATPTARRVGLAGDRCRCRRRGTSAVDHHGYAAAAAEPVGGRHVAGGHAVRPPALQPVLHHARRRPSGHRCRDRRCCRPVDPGAAGPAWVRRAHRGCARSAAGRDRADHNRGRTRPPARQRVADLPRGGRGGRPGLLRRGGARAGADCPDAAGRRSHRPEPGRGGSRLVGQCPDHSEPRARQRPAVNPGGPGAVAAGHPLRYRDRLVRCHQHRGHLPGNPPRCSTTECRCSVRRCSHPRSRCGRSWPRSSSRPSGLWSPPCCADVACQPTRPDAAPAHAPSGRLSAQAGAGSPES